MGATTFLVNCAPSTAPFFKFAVVKPALAAFSPVAFAIDEVFNATEEAPFFKLFSPPLNIMLMSTSSRFSVLPHVHGRREYFKSCGQDQENEEKERRRREEERRRRRNGDLFY